MSVDKWKLTDFGLTAEGTSKVALTTQLQRGTEGYRAPEILSDNSPGRASNKADIFALGCLIYELAFGKKAFWRDFQLFLYARGEEKLDIPAEELDLDHRRRAYLLQMISRMLEIDWWKRPSASHILDELKRLQNKRGTMIYEGRVIEIEQQSGLWIQANWSPIWYEFPYFFSG